jgi:cystathionine beta-lyase
LIVSNDADYDVMGKIAFIVNHGAGTSGVLANAAAYSEGGPWLDDVLSYIDRNRSLLGELLAKHLPEGRYREPEGTYIAWLDCRGLPDVTEGASWAEFFAKKANVGVTDGVLCGEAGIGHVRLMLSTPSHILETIIIAMATAVREAQ